MHITLVPSSLCTPSDLPTLLKAAGERKLTSSSHTATDKNQYKNKSFYLKSDSRNQMKNLRVLLQILENSLRENCIWQRRKISTLKIKIEEETLQTKDSDEFWQLSLALVKPCFHRFRSLPYQRRLN